MHNFCILVGGINSSVVAPYCVSAVGIVVTECDRLCMYILGHDILKWWLSVKMVRYAILVCMINGS